MKKVHVGGGSFGSAGEAGVEPDCILDEMGHVFYEIVGDAGTAKKGTRVPGIGMPFLQGRGQRMSATAAKSAAQTLLADKRILR